MKAQHAVITHENQDYENFQDDLTDEQAIEILKDIKIDWLPRYGHTGTEGDFMYYGFHVAMNRAIDALIERNKK